MEKTKRRERRGRPPFFDQGKRKSAATTARRTGLKTGHYITAGQTVGSPSRLPSFLRASRVNGWPRWARRAVPLQGGKRKSGRAEAKRRERRDSSQRTHVQRRHVGYPRGGAEGFASVSFLPPFEAQGKQGKQDKRNDGRGVEGAGESSWLRKGLPREPGLVPRAWLDTGPGQRF